MGRPDSESGHFRDYLCVYIFIVTFVAVTQIRSEKYLMSRIVYGEQSKFDEFEHILPSCNSSRRDISRTEDRTNLGRTVSESRGSAHFCDIRILSIG